MRSIEKVHAYWRNPDDMVNRPQDYVTAEHQQRTDTLVAIIQRLPMAKSARILELGCNAGRNLEGLMP